MYKPLVIYSNTTYSAHSRYPNRKEGKMLTVVQRESLIYLVRSVFLKCSVGDTHKWRQGWFINTLLTET